MDLIGKSFTEIRQHHFDVRLVTFTVVAVTDRHITIEEPDSHRQIPRRVFDNLVAKGLYMEAEPGTCDERWI